MAECICGAFTSASICPQCGYALVPNPLDTSRPSPKIAGYSNPPERELITRRDWKLVDPAADEKDRLLLDESEDSLEKLRTEWRSANRHALEKQDELQMVEAARSISETRFVQAKEALEKANADTMRLKLELQNADRFERRCREELEQEGQLLREYETRIARIRKDLEDAKSRTTQIATRGTGIKKTIDALKERLHNRRL